MGEELQSRKVPICVFGWISLLTLMLDRRSIDSMVRMSTYWRRWQRPLTKYVAQKQKAKGRGLTDGQVKHAIAEEEKVYAQFTQDASIYSALSARQWEPFTQGGGALVRPDFGPSGVNVTFEDPADAPFGTDESVRFGAGDQEGNGYGMPFDISVVSRDFGHAMLNAGTEARMLSAGP